MQVALWLTVCAAKLTAISQGQWWETRSVCQQFNVLSPFFFSPLLRRSTLQSVISSFTRAHFLAICSSRLHASTHSIALTWTYTGVTAASPDHWVDYEYTESHTKQVCIPWVILCHMSHIYLGAEAEWEMAPMWRDGDACNSYHLPVLEEVFECTN